LIRREMLALKQSNTQGILVSIVTRVKVTGREEASDEEINYNIGLSDSAT
jgi:hypothetical protein